MEAFITVSTQWRTGFAGLVGLDYAAVECALNAVGIRFKSVIGGLQIMESHILKLANKSKEH